MMISNGDSESLNGSSNIEFKKILDSFSEKIKIKDYQSTKNTATNTTTTTSNDNNNEIYTISLTGNGSEPPFNGKGLILPTLGTLRIIIPAGLDVASFNPIIYTNYQSGIDSTFQRDKFYVFHKGNITPYNGNNDLIFEQKIEKYGCFDYYVEWEEINNPTLSSPLPASTTTTSSSSDNIKRGEIGTFQINPILKINDQILPSDSIILQTFLTKCIGPISGWEKHIEIASKLGYNMIHYTPVQEIGASGSAYSIYDQQSISSKIFENSGNGSPMPSEDEKLLQLSTFINDAEKKYGVLGMIDLVWNHTAHNSNWLNQHPEAGYNTDNSPHLKSAVLLDRALQQFGKGLFGKEIESIEHLELIVNEIKEKVIVPLKLWEFYVLNIDKEMEIFKNTFFSSNRTRETGGSSNGGAPFSPSFLKSVITNPNSERQEIIKSITKNGTIRSPSYDRYSLHVDLDYTYRLLDQLVSFNNGIITHDEQIQKYQDILSIVNLELYRQYDHDVEAIVKNITERIKYERVSSHGPKLGVISVAKPLLNSYFTTIQYRDPANGGAIREIPLANNGWIYNHNPTIDFAGSESRAYLRRDVIIWGDCVKLRYGSSCNDNPWLWNHMKTYTQKMARIFHAIRIDNCHSTPIHLAQYLLDAAREIRPDIYVTCELFTGSEDIDSIFVKKLGINSLIREAMQAGDTSELVRVCYRYGGRTIGSIQDPTTFIEDASIISSNGNNTPIEYNTKPLGPTLPPALFMDCTHDNETPFQKRTIADTLPNAAIVCFSVCAIGSTRGYDEIYPKTIDLVNETRFYNSAINLSRGILPVRAILNRLHLELSVNDYCETHIHQDGNIVVIQRYSPSLKKSIFMVSHCSFSSSQDDSHVHQLQIPCKVNEFIFGARITNASGDHFNDSKLLNGITIDTEIQYGDKVENQFCQLFNHDGHATLKLLNFHKGSVLVFRGEICKDNIDSMNKIHSMVNSYGMAGGNSELKKSFEKVNLIDMNVLLFRINEEEKFTTGNGAYHIQSIGQLPFCGLQGFVSILKPIAKNNDLGHPLCENLRQGNWAMDYIVNRLNNYDHLSEVKNWLSNCFEQVKKLPRHLIPMYFYEIIICCYRAAIERCVSLMPSFIKNSSNSNWFIRTLAVTGIQFFGVCTPLISNPNVLEGVENREASLAAGFPHFATGYMRSWGRDTFISLRGILLVTGRYREAINIIVGFGSCLRFGLIPNLLDCGTKPRFNSRDSVWWYLRAIQDTYNCLPTEKEKDQFLNQTQVYRLFPPTGQISPTSTIAEMIQEILQHHATGIHFREPNAGIEIDDRMRDEGFNIDIDLNQSNGFLYGGNRSNAGTWMDKMGESTKANNYGEPATPRDGAPIEITAMLYSTVSWLSQLYQTDKFKHGGVDVITNKQPSPKSTLTYIDWAKLIESNFEKYYYIPSSGEDKQYNINSNYVHRRYIYKDVVGSANVFSDYQFRPNICVAMSFAPKLFNASHASKCIDIIRSNLVGPLGMRTLDPNDPNYHGNYDNASDSGYKPTSKGFNYHNGPEWVWVYGFFLESIVQFKHFPSISTKAHLINSLLIHHKSHIQNDLRASLPELTNRDGHYCRFSCDSQAWSIATILASLYQLSITKN